MAVDNNLINQICIASGLKGKDLEALKARLAKLSDTELQAELTKAIAGKNLTGDMGLVVEKTAKNNASTTEQKILSADGNTVEAVITYENNRPIKLTKFQNGNTIATTTFTYNVENDVSFVTAKTVNADKSTTVTTALEVDENGNISNEDIVDRATTRLDGTVTTIYPHNGLLLEQVENPDGKKVLTAFNGTNIEEYDKKKLNRVFQQTENNGKIHYAEYDGHGNTKTTVQNGESPALIAQKFNVKENALRRLNSNKGKNAITQVGADILIPGEVNADEKVMTKRRSKEENLAAFTKQEYQRQADKLYSTEVKQTTLTKNYNGNFFNLAKDILIQNGKTSPSKAEITSMMQQLQLLNGNIPLKNGSRINVPGKKADTNEVNQLSNYGFKPSESTHGFYEKFNKLSKNDKQSVLSTLQYLKSQKITEPNAVKLKLFEYLNINLFDSDKTIPKQGVNANILNRQASVQTVPLEVYVIEYLGLDINSQDGKKVYERLNSLPQEELNKLSAQDFVMKGHYAADPQNGKPFKAFKGKNFDEVAAALASKGVVIQTQIEIQLAQNSSQNIKMREEREEVQTRQIAAANIEIMYEQAIAEIQNYQDSQGWFNVGYWREKLGNLIKNDYVDTSFEATVERLTKEKKLASLRLKTASYNASEFNAVFKDLTGVEYDKTKVEKFIEEANKENNDWQPAYEAAFGSKMLDWAKSRVKQVSTTDGLCDIAAMLIGTEAIAGTAAFKGTVKGVGTQVGKVVGKKTTQVVTGMAAGGVNLGTWTLLSGTVNNLTASGIDAKSWETWKQTGIATIESAGFGAAGGLINATVVDKVVKGVSKAMEKPATKALNAVEKSFENGTAKTGTDIMTTYIMNETPGILAKSAGFVTEVAGFTAYETALDLCKDFFTKDGFNEASMREKLVELGKDANEVKNMHGADLVASYLGNTALGQIKMLGEVKGIANLMMMRQGGKTAQALAYKEGLSKCEALKDLKVKPITVNGKEVYEVTYPNGNRAVASSVTEIIGNCQFLLQMEQLKNIAKIQLSEELHTPKGEISEASKTNPAENAKEKVLSEVAKDMTDDGMKLWTSEDLEAELDFAEKNPNAPQENLEAMSLVINGKLGKHLTKMYADLGKSFEDVITKHSDEISHLENKYKNNSKKFAQAFTEFLAKRLGVSGIAPKVEFAEMKDCHGYFDWPNGKLMVSKELVSNPKAIETIIAHEFVHVIQFKDIIAAKGQDGIQEILSSLNNGAYLENVTRSTIEHNGIDYSKLSSEEIADYKFVVAEMLAEDVMRANSKLVEFAQNNPIEKGSLKSYLSEIYKNEHSNYVNDVNSSEYYNQVIESEAYYLGNGRMGKGIIERIDLSKVKAKKSQKTNSIRNNNINSPKGRIEISEDKRVLEGGIKPEELDEVAPFARHLSNEVTDPIAILGDNFDKRVNTVDLKPHETVGMPLKYSVHDFADNIKSLVNNLKIEEQQAILEKFNINLVYTGEGFEISSIPKIPSNKEIKTSLDRKISEEIKKFTTENEFEINNPELKVFLDDFVKVVPEFLFTVGKKQHATHAYTLDVHILKTLQNATEHPEYKNLSQEDKMVINTALMLHDIGKRFIDERTPDENHADISYKAAISILDRFNLPSDTKQRIAKLIENHEFYKNYNASYTSFLNEQEQNSQRKAAADEHGWSFTPETDYSNYFERSVKAVAGRFVNLQDAKLAKIFTFADLKSVNPEIKYTEEEWNNYQCQDVEYTGFHKKVTRTQTDAEFLEYIDKSMSYIEKELSQYKDNKIDDELVYPSELQKTSQNLFGRTDFFERIHRNQNGSFGTHRSDLEFCIQARKDLIAAGFKAKEVANQLGKMLKYDYDHNFDAQATKEFMDVFIANKDFIKSHNLHIDNFRTASALQGEIDLIKQKENIANTFTEFGVNDEQMQKRLSECLYIEEYQKGTSFNQEAYNTMIELFKTNKYTPEEIQSIIHNSFSVKNHRGVFRDSDNSGLYFNKEIYNTILELAKEEPIENAINDAHLCFESATPESGWVAVPELVEAVREFNRLGIKDKHFIKTLFDFNYKDGKNKYDNTRVLESVTKNEKYNRALEYAKQGFEGNDLAIIVNTCELSNGKTIYSKEVQDKIAELVKLGVYRQFDNCDWIQRNLFTEEDNNNLKFNHGNYEFFMKMFETGIKAKQLDNIVYQCANSTFHAREAAPDKILENGNFSKAQVEAIVKFYKEIGFDKIPYSGTAYDYRNLAESFMDVVELTPEESDKMVDVSALGHSYRISKMSDYMAPFRYVNEEKFNQAMDYYKKGVDINVLKELTQNPTLHETLKNETDLSFIESANDATLVANFWNLRDIKSINELSKSEKMTLMTQLMVNKSAIENNNVAARISLLPTTSEGYAQMMKDLAHSFGFDKPAYTTAQKSQIQSNITDLTARLQQVSITELKQDGVTNQLVSSIKQLIPEISETNIRTLQRIVKNPEFAKLSEADKSTLTLATLFAKAGNSVDAAIDASVCAKRLGLSDTEAMNLFAIVKNSHLVDDFMSIRKNVKMNNSRRYATIISSELDELFVTSAMELKNYNNFQLAKMLYTANENYLSSDMLKEFAPDLYNDIVTAKKNGLTTQQAFTQLRTKPENADRIEEIKIKAAEEYAPSRYLSKMMEAEIHRIKASDILLPQTDLQDFISKQSPEWLAAHQKVVNGRNVMVISSDEIPDFFHLSHTTQAYAITGKADATTNISNFEAFATLFDNKVVCLSYSGTGKTAVVGDTGLLIRTPNTAQYVARGTDISSIAKDIPTMVSEYISNRSDIDQRGFQSKQTKDFDRQYFSSMIKEELQAGYRTLLNKKLELEEMIRNGNTEVQQGLQVDYRRILLKELELEEMIRKDNTEVQQELNDINAQMRSVDDKYIAHMDALINKANGKTIDIQFIRENDAELAKAYDKVLSYINVEHRGVDGLMRTEYHNEVLGSNTEPVGIFVRNEKTLFELTDDYLKKAEEANWPVIILK